MMAYAMKLSAKAIQHLLPGQLKPWTSHCIVLQYWPDILGEDNFVDVMGGLHIEMNVIKLIRDILTGSGWTAILVQLK